ncbi:MAG: WcaF family extracellular polysaccharide biosynthesis acetyltransferase [Pseudomonadota bacterium]
MSTDGQSPREHSHLQGGEGSTKAASITPQSQAPQTGVDLASFQNTEFVRGRSRFTEGLWIVAQALFVSSFIPGGLMRRVVLRAFGATIGKGVTIHPRMRVKFPWKLTIGDNCWFGQDVWIDNLEPVTVGDNVCVSQGAYLCTGSHDWSVPSFDLTARPIALEDGCWIAARTNVGPGVTVGEGAVLTLGSSAYADLSPWTIYSGTPAAALKPRRMKSPS